MNAEVLNIFNEDKIDVAVNAALEGYKAKNPEATPEELGVVGRAIRQNIVESRIKDKFLNSKANRSARKAHVAEKATELGVQLIALHELVSVPLDFEPDPVSSRAMPLFHEILGEFLNSLGLEEKVERAVTFAVKHEPAGDGYTKFTYSLSAQNPDDEPDALVGKEYAIARFANGQIRTDYIPNGLIGGMSLADTLRHFLSAGLVQSYAEKYL